MNNIEKKILNIVSNASSRYEIWQQLLNENNFKTLVEIGVWKGDFARRILEQCEKVEKYYMIDPWAKLPDWNKPFNVSEEVFEDIYLEAMEKVKFASKKVVVLRGKTSDVIDEIPDSSIDFGYIDGDHTLRGITIDLLKLYNKVKDGGFIAGDDFTPNPWQHDIQYEPTLVCPYSIYFAEAMNVPIIALPYNQFLIVKRNNSSFSFLDYTGKYGDVSLNKLPQNRTRHEVKSMLKKVIGKIKTVNK